MRITGGQVFDLHEGFLRRDVCFDGRLLSDSSSDGKIYDAAGCYVIPGLTDLHFHGCKGQDFSDGDAGGLETMAKYELSRGVTQICPAGMTLLEDQLIRICRVAAAHREADRPGAALCGVEEIVTVSLANTTADYDTAMEAFRLGARQVTHLFNAMPPFSHRAPGVVGAALDTPGCMVELICDGIHIHPAVVRSVFKMFGEQRVILISDSMRAAGMPDGQYTLGGQDVTVKGKLATLADGTIAGSVTDLMGCLKTAVSFGIPLHAAVRAAAVNPARAIGIYSRCGSLEPGKRANVVILDERLELKDVFFRGELVRGEG